MHDDLLDPDLLRDRKPPLWRRVVRSIRRRFNGMTQRSRAFWFVVFALIVVPMLYLGIPLELERWRQRNEPPCQRTIRPDEDFTNPCEPPPYVSDAAQACQSTGPHVLLSEPPIKVVPGPLWRLVTAVDAAMEGWTPARADQLTYEAYTAEEGLLIIWWDHGEDVFGRPLVNAWAECPHSGPGEPLVYKILPTVSRTPISM